MEPPTLRQNSSTRNINYQKKIKATLQLAVFIMMLVMLVMNIFRGGANQAQSEQILYKMMDMPQLGALSAPTEYTHVPRNRTAD